MEGRRSRRDRRDYILSGSNDQSLLYGQAEHRSEHLITALDERWRPETHTFMFSEEEMTITLQNVGLITELPVNGAAVTGRSRHHWPSVCEALLGVVPTNNTIRGCYLKMIWLAEEFSQLLDDADQEVVERFTQAYILRVIGSLFSDTSASRVNLMFLPLLADLEEAGNYSWGGTCLAWLYRQLCKAINPKVMQMAGPLFVLQLWAWDRIIAVAPTLSNRVPHHDAPLDSRWSNTR
ncbi:protein MAIN-LIKE 2-like [Manihot esculenta]|uniref:protein MAIN-LIKE 2-like n=1 Tax=Manihot esculenta TaxID=3983 RepID=UPI000B5D8132|nr:protein MAIN-LIKE 2-like [Manihot esculenta]